MEESRNLRLVLERVTNYCVMRFVGLEELDGCGMARSSSESNIPCN